MKTRLASLVMGVLVASRLLAQSVPDNLVVEGVLEHPPELVREAGR